MAIPKGQMTFMSWVAFCIKKVYLRKMHTSAMRISGGFLVQQKYMHSLRIPSKKKCLVIESCITSIFKMLQLTYLRPLQVQLWSFLVKTKVLRVLTLYHTKMLNTHRKHILRIHNKCKDIVCITLLQELCL